MIKLYTDAATKNDQAGLGILIVHNEQQYQLKQKTTVKDNHQAEFKAAIAGFSEVIKHFPPETLLFYSDSKIVIDSLEKNYSRSFAKELMQLNALRADLPLIIDQWIPDTQNKGAHNLALQALHA